MSNPVGFFLKPYPHVKDYFSLIDETVAHGLQITEGFNDCEFQQPDLEAAKRIREYADARGVRFCCFSCFCDLTGADTQQSISRMKSYAQVAQILGAPYLHHTLIPEFTDPSLVLPYREQLLQKSIDGVRDIFDFATELGVLPAYEDQGFVVNGVEGFGEFLTRVDRPVGVVADFGNICQLSETVTDFVRAFGSRVVHAHVKDYKLLPGESNGRIVSVSRLCATELGTGIVPIREAIDLLKEANYTGCYSLEFDQTTSDIKASLQLLQSWL